MTYHVKIEDGKAVKYIKVYFMLSDMHEHLKITEPVSDRLLVQRYSDEIKEIHHWFTDIEQTIPKMDFIQHNQILTNTIQIALSMWVTESTALLALLKFKNFHVS